MTLQSPQLTLWYVDTQGLLFVVLLCIEDCRFEEIFYFLLPRLSLGVLVQCLRKISSFLTVPLGILSCEQITRVSAAPDIMYLQQIYNDAPDSSDFRISIFFKSIIIHLNSMLHLLYLSCSLEIGTGMEPHSAFWCHCAQIFTCLKTES